MKSGFFSFVGRWMGFLALGFFCLQLFFVLRIAAMAVVNPQSSAFERSEAYRSASQGNFEWRQTWVSYDNISDNLKRAIIASEDGEFVYHDGVEWEAIEKAWARNAQAELRVQSSGKSKGKAAKIVGGSTITQQLAKNLLLSGERNLLRKGQEFVLSMALETFLTKRRILEIYLNHVEWGNGVFGAQAAAQRYYKKNAAQLSPLESARLAVMLPRPKYFEQNLQSPYLNGRAQTISARMADAELP
jgi:monofunctional glycosyltransferase